MKKGTRGEARIHVDRLPDVLYEMVCDVTRMGDWSPETTRCEWIGGASRAAVGARFKGTNRRGIARWSTKPVIVAADPGKEFAFETSDTRWTYRFEAADDGTELIESFRMTRDEPVYLTLATRYLLRLADRKTDLEAGMQRTLEGIKAIAESEAR